jgi:diguanylate cyclase (GGDEF)-like protein
MEEKIKAKHTFTHGDKARLFHILGDMLGFPRRVDWSSEEGGEEIYALEKLLLYRIGHMSMGSGTIQVKMERYITIGDDNQILTLVELAPQAPISAWQDRRIRPNYSPQAHSAGVVEALNQWLESTGHEARFVNGKLEREGFADKTPKALKDLPKREALWETIDRAVADKAVVSVVFIDLDNFKAVNDKLGHPAGDACLEQVVTTIGKVVAGKGRLYRYGEGDEFCVALKNFTLEEAAVTAERIRKEIDAANPGGEVKVTASIGVASSAQLDSGQGGRQLLDLVDKAHYESKNGGKNRVTVSKKP